ncbi:hypothetical protein [Streptomyces sp. XY533]|uniref:hypothetical protein n=1 Tax=Streptomyces sp. XY533 TaxID=1519481 RepID=UPI0007C7D87A|nr:hypothetical protein [Streptomyces sp. XY533]
MDGIDLDWQLTQAWPGDPTLGGYVPPVGEHVFCYRPSDGKAHCGVVDDNRAGLFLTTCAGGRVALTAERWAVTPVGAACHTGRSPS